MTATKVSSSSSAINHGSTVTTSKEPKMTHCSYCPMSFKKLEHAQRHERTHTLDRPYACATCGKTFARQDTLNRHARLHVRKAEDGPMSKGGRKKKHTAASSAGSDTSPTLTSTKNLEKAPKRTKKATGSSAATATSGLPIASPVDAFSFPTLPALVVPPSFAAYSRPADLNNPMDHEPTIFPTRRYSDVIPSGLPTAAASSARVTRPRANTLAGLPEALGCFSLIGSPESNGIASSSSGASDSDSEEDSEEDEGGDESSQTNSTTHGHHREASKRSLFELENVIRSEYPSPAFSSYSAHELHRDSIHDLESILANDPLHRPAGNTSLDFRLTTCDNPEAGFDLESFAASVEGPSPGTLDDLLSSGPIVKSPEERYPTPPSAPMPSQALVPPRASFNFAEAFNTDELAQREQAAREQVELFFHRSNMQSLPTLRTVPLPMPNPFSQDALNASVASHFGIVTSGPLAPFNGPPLDLGSPSIAPADLSSPPLAPTSLPSVSIPNSMPGPASLPTSHGANFPASANMYSSSFPSLMIPNGLGLTSGPFDTSSPSLSNTSGLHASSSEQLLLNAYKRCATSQVSQAFYMPNDQSNTAPSTTSPRTSRLGLPPVLPWTTVPNVQ